MKLKAVIVLTIVILTLLVLIRPSTAQGGECNQCDNDQCVKLDIGGERVSWSMPAGASGYITEVVVKAGSDNQDGGACYAFNQDGNNGCYAVSGIGTKTATVIKIGVGSGCKDISHVLVHWRASNTATPSPTLTPTATATIPPTSTPGPSPTPTSTPDPRWTPTPTKPPPTQGWMRAFTFCKDNGNLIPENGVWMSVFCEEGPVFRSASDGFGFVFRVPVADAGCTVTDVVTDKGACIELYRGGDNYPPEPLFAPFYENGNNEFSGKVGEPAVVCYTSCSIPKYHLPVSGGEFADWFVTLVLHYLDVAWRLPVVSISK